MLRIKLKIYFREFLRSVISYKGQKLPSQGPIGDQKILSKFAFKIIFRENFLKSIPDLQRPLNQVSSFKFLNELNFFFKNQKKIQNHNFNIKIRSN